MSGQSTTRIRKKTLERLNRVGGWYSYTMHEYFSHDKTVNKLIDDSHILDKVEKDGE